MMIDQVPAGLNSEDHAAGGAQCSLKCCLCVSVSFSQECAEIRQDIKSRFGRKESSSLKNDQSAILEVLFSLLK